MARPLPYDTAFDARNKRPRRNRAWPLGLLVFVMTVANVALWLTIYALTHGQMVIDPRFL